MQYALGHFVRFTQANNNVLAFQNFFIRGGVNRDGYLHAFMPFGFSGISINTRGDNVDAALTFPNNDLSRAWADQATTEAWVATVDVCLLNPDDSNTQQLLHTYAGVIAAGGWDETSINLRLNSVLDAVGGDIPNRSLHQRLVGRLPTSSYVRF
jgi:hypothetical protein